MSGKNQHVVPDPNGGWNIKGENAQRSTKHYANKQAAIDKAREIANNQNSELLVHNRDGKIASRDSHGNDPHPPKG